MSDWKTILDAVLPPPGIDLGILNDPAALEVHARRAITSTSARLTAPADDLHQVLDMLFADPIS